jgi:hypothetical protein
VTQPEPSQSEIPDGHHDPGHVMTEPQWAAVLAAREAHLSSLEAQQ